MHAIRINVSEATGNSPGAIAFHRDMLLNTPINVDIAEINKRRQLKVDRDTARMNTKRYAYDYKVGGKVMKKKHEYTKLEHRWSGPFEITQVHVNGNVTIRLQNGVTKRLNIRRLKPYNEPTESVLGT